MRNVMEYAELTRVAHPPIFGFEYKNRWRMNPGWTEGIGERATREFNLIRVAGYIPYVNVIVGVALIALAVYAYSQGPGAALPAISRLALRGVLTITCGYWLLGADIAKYLLQENALQSHTLKA